MDDHTLESFRFGFLNRCARNGLTAPEALDLADRHVQNLDSLNKQAAGAAVAGGLGAAAGLLGGKALDYGEKFLSKGTGYIEKLLAGLAGIATPGLLVAGPAAGALGGYALGSLHGIEDESEEERRQRELAQTYQEGTRRLSGR